MPDTDLDERVNRLRERAEADFPEAWVFSDAKDGPEFVGFFQRLEQASTAYGPTHVAIFKQPDGTERSVWLFHTVLRNAMAKQRPEPGELVVIRSLGKVTPKGGGTKYEDYRVVVDRAYTATSWDEIDPSGASPEEVRPDESDFAPVGVPKDDDIPF